jgi:YegS/Rv2252/BmrU family lipid kinase
MSAPTRPRPAADESLDAGARRPVRTVAVLAHQRKTLGGGLDELRALLRAEGFDKPLWYEVPKSRKAPKQARKVRKSKPDLVFVWGGDGMVQRCVDAFAGSGITVAILPAGTANLLATNLAIPKDLPAAVDIGLRGRRRTLDLGKLNGEHFAVMAGVGFDGEMIHDADRNLKDRVGQLAYVWTGLKHVRDDAARVKVRVDGTKWFDGKASCVLLGNVGEVAGGVRAFEEARPDDGRLDVGVATAEGAWQWARTLVRMAADRAGRSPLVRTTQATRVDVKLATPMVYELDGGARGRTTRLKARVVPGAITICVPDTE